VLADASDTVARRLIERTVAGTLQYPDPAIAALSRAMCLASPASGSPLQASVIALQQAVEAYPADFAYALLIDRAMGGGVDRDQLVRYLEKQELRLREMNEARADGIQILKCRLNIQRVLSRAYDPNTEAEERRQARDSYVRLRERIRELEGKPWARGQLRRL
jgi:hypothetical protein